MKAASFAFALSLVACARQEPAPPPSVAVVPVASVASVAPVSPQPSPVAPPSAAPPPASTLSGTLGSERFTAQSALLVRVNESADSHSSVFPGQTFHITWSFLLIFDRPLTCADVGKNMMPRSPVAGERFVKFQVQGRWPLAVGRTFAVGSDPQQPAADGFSGNVWQGQSGSILRGTVRVASATTAAATLDMDLTTKTSGASSSGALAGTVLVTVCP